MDYRSKSIRRTSVFTPVLLAVLSLLLLNLSAACSRPPLAQVSADITVGAAPLTVTFTNSSQNADKLSWDFGDGATQTSSAAERTVSHEYTRAGTYTVTITASKGSDPGETSTATIAVTVEPGPLDKLTLDAASVMLSPGQEHQFTVIALDRFGNPIPGLTHTFQAASNAGLVNAQGLFTSTTRAGTYQDAVTAQVTQGDITRSASASITIQPGPLHQVSIEPANASLGVTREQIFSATAFDEYGNAISDILCTFQAASNAGQVDAQGLFTATTRAGTYQDAVTAKATQGDITRSASASVTIQPGPLHQVSIEPANASLEVTTEQIFFATTFDEYGNAISDIPCTFQAASNAGQVDAQGLFTAGTRAGAYQDAVTAKATQGDITRSVSASVTIQPGPLHHVAVTPASAELKIGESVHFEANALDAYDNPLPDAKVTWTATASVGTMTAEGSLTAGTRSGAHDKAVKATAVLGTTSAEGTASVTVKPDPLDSVSLSPVEALAGASRQLEASVVDRYGNQLTDVQVVWTVRDENVGAVTTSGLLTAGQVAQSFADALEVRVTQGILVRTAKTSVTVVAGPLAQVVVAPSPADIGMGITQQFVAVGADQYGNRISGLTFAWSVEKGGGTIDANGLFTAGDTPGTYQQTVRASTTQGHISLSATATVTVEPDRILFMSDRDYAGFDLYTMNVDGTNVKRLTTGAGYYPFLPYSSWSPDGRRIAYGTCPDYCGIIAMSDVGDWAIALSVEDAFDPSWSPDGSRLVFRAWVDNNWELHVMDVDGGSWIRLTNNTASDHLPTWSPDGRKVAFVSNRDGNFEIYVMNADGSNVQRVTNHSETDTYPSWSPDGSEILFQSGRSGITWGIYVMNANGTNVRQLTPTIAGESYNYPSWSPNGSQILFHAYKDGRETAEIYVMDRDGQNMRRLTDNASDDLAPKWAPRKRGVEVSEASVIIPNASSLKPLTVQAVTAKVRAAIVRIKTDLGSGSGFIIRSDGLILTNNHVISDAKQITVYLDDGRSFTATVHKRDMVRDLAVLKINTTGLPTLELGDLSQVQLGSEAVVIGYPLGSTDLTVTRGVVSSVKKDGGRNITWVQTDSAVNPGNSGGPLLDLQGRVIGVVSAKLVALGIENVGYAISVNTLGTYLSTLLKD